MTQDDWREALKSEDKFKDFIVRYFKEHKQLSGNYDIPAYYEHYTVKLDSNDGLVITLATGMNQGVHLYCPINKLRKCQLKSFGNCFYIRNLLMRK